MKRLRAYTKNKKLLISLGIFLLIVIYLNRSYAYIYEHIDDVGFQSSVVQEEYVIGTDSLDTLEYVALGDSLTAGVGVDDYKESYPYQFAQKMSEGPNSILLKPLAMPGARTKDISSTFLDEVVSLDPDIITVLSGVNDVYGNVSNKDFERDYRELVKSIVSNTNSEVSLINLPYIGDASLILPPYNYYFDYKTKQFNNIIKKVAEENNLTYIDLYSQAKIFEQDNLYYSLDAFHPSASGYIKWASYIYENSSK